MIDTPVYLSDRRIICVKGADAKSFLQNIMSNDVEKAKDGIVYSLLLTPQGMFLHDFFVLTDEWHDTGGYLLDMHAAQVDEFLKRMVMFKLRAKVTLEILPAEACHVYSHSTNGMPDPRIPGIGKRFYSITPLTEDCADVSCYHDARIAAGVPDGSLTIKAQKDFPADMNLDHLNALGWEKGCFIGQEVVARMYHRGLAKKRLAIVTGQDLQAGDILSPVGRPVGEIREVDSAAQHGLALIRLDVLSDTPQNLSVLQGRIERITLPEYLYI